MVEKRKRALTEATVTMTLCLLLTVLSQVALAATSWGTLKPNLYFAVKERA